MKLMHMVYARTNDDLRAVAHHIRKKGYEANLRDINKTEPNEIESCHFAVFVDSYPELEKEYEHAEFVDEDKRIVRPTVLRLYEGDQIGGVDADVESPVSERAVSRGRARTVKQAQDDGPSTEDEKPPKLERPEGGGRKGKNVKTEDSPKE